ncbi:MAG: ABC transporter ATP-binding protein [Vicinamibacterales bacterium]
MYLLAVAMSAPLLRLEKVVKRYGQRTAVDAVSLQVQHGECVVLLGPSGCGKTTILRLIAGLEQPDSGEISLDGHTVARARRTLVPPYERGLGYVFQDLALWPHLTVRGNLDFVMRSAGVRSTERVERQKEILALVRIESLAERHPHELSGGEQQRAALARALAGRPRLLLMDEPFSSLDPDLRLVLREEVQRLQRSLRLTSIYVTHDLEDAATLADRVIEMRKGRIITERLGVPSERRR